VAVTAFDRNDGVFSMTTLLAALSPGEVMGGYPELAARLDRPGEILAGWLVAVALLLALAAF
jgi:hypothetical protein